MPSSSTISVKAFIVAALLLSEVYAKCFFNAVTFTSFFHPGAWLLLAECYCFQTWCSNCTSLLVMGLCQQWVPHIWTPSLSPFCQGLNCALCNTGLRPFCWRGGKQEVSCWPVNRNIVFNCFQVTHSVKLRYFFFLFPLSQYFTLLFPSAMSFDFSCHYNQLAPSRLGQERQWGRWGFQLCSQGCVRDLSLLETVLYFLNAVSCSDAGGAICLI